MITNNNYSKALGLILLGYFLCAHAEIHFGDKTSSLNVGNQSFFKVKTNEMLVKSGKINRTELGNITGSPIRFDRGVFSSFNSESLLAGVFNPGLDQGLELGNNPNIDDINILISNPGGFRHKLLAKPGTNFLRGQPLFFGPNDIELTDETTLLSFAIQNTLNTNVILNNGVVFLQDDLRLGDDAVFLGNGQVVFNNRRLSLGGNASTWDGNIFWNSALDLQFNSRVTLNGIWTFFADSQINGNGNVLDIANGGAIVVLPNSRLRLSGVQIKGLGTGAILMGDGSELILSDTEIEMNQNYVFNSGGIYVDGSTNIVTKNNFLTFEQSFDSHGSLTVDRVALSYDTLDFLDQFNIRPLRIQDPAHKFITIINGGSIRRVRTEPITFLDYSSDTVLQRYAIINPQRIVRIFPEVDQNGQLNFNIIVNGDTNFLKFTRADVPLMFVSDDVHITYRNIIFENFSPLHLSLGNNSSLTFGDKTTVSLGRNEVLNSTWVFEGNAILKGGGSILELGPQGNIVVQGANSSLLLDGITIKGASGNNIRCLNNSSKLVFRNVKWIQSGNFTYDTGGIDVFEDWNLPSAFVFNYTSSALFRILSNAIMFLSRGATLNYQPISASRSLLQMIDASSTLKFDDATLSAPAPGIQLLNGRVVLTDRTVLQNTGGTTAANGIVFGNGIALNNVFIDKPFTLAIVPATGFFADLTV